MNASITAAAPAGTADTATSGQHEKKKIADAARQFEALLIGQILKTACDASTMTGSTGEADAAGSTAIEMAQEQFAAALSARGGLGIATMVTNTIRGDGQ